MQRHRLPARPVAHAIERRAWTERHRRHDHPRRADAALRAAVLHERALQRMPAAEPLDRRDARPAGVRRGTRHELTGRPSTSTVHAPHSPSPHPSLVPVSPQSSRSTSSSRFIGCASTRVRLPLSVNTFRHRGHEHTERWPRIRHRDTGSKHTARAASRSLAALCASAARRTCAFVPVLRDLALAQPCRPPS